MADVNAFSYHSFCLCSNLLPCQNVTNKHYSQLIFWQRFPPMVSEVEQLCQRAKSAAQAVGSLSGQVRQSALNAMAKALEEAKAEVMRANAEDLAAAEKAGLSKPMLKRLRVDEKVFAYMKKRLTEVAQLPDPLGRVLDGSHVNPKGLKVERISVPLGVVAVIYESRPNVTVDAVSVSLKSGNAVILRGGSEGIQTNAALAKALSEACVSCGVPKDAIQLLSIPGHEAVKELLQMDKYIDVLIPRGGKGLIKAVAEGTRIPTIKHYEGICHQYVAADADVTMACDLILNSKLESVEVCNALEGVLIDSGAADRVVPVLSKQLSEKSVEMRGCPRFCKLVPNAIPATEEDWSTEYLAPILHIKIVDGLQEAVDHINGYGSHHTDGIVTSNVLLASRFVQLVDSASVLVNASTRLSGGGDYGLGAVVGISTDKLHARGPVGINELTTYKWVAYGNGHLRN